MCLYFVCPPTSFIVITINVQYLFYRYIAPTSSWWVGAVFTMDNYMLHMDWKQLRKLHKIIHYGETILINTFTGITTIVHGEVLQMFVQ